MPHAIGPRAMISFCMLAAPETLPYSLMVAFGKVVMGPQKPDGGKVEQVRATFAASQFHLTALQKPSSLSDEHAMYGLEVSYEMPEPFFDSECSHWYGPSTDPPWQE